MSKLVQLVESSLSDKETVIKQVATIKKECAPFIKYLRKNTDRLLFRGMRGKKEFGIQTRRKDRQPLNTHPMYDKLINLALDEEGVITRNEGIFCAINPYQPQEFGKVYAIFPKGKFDFYYVDGISDITFDLQLAKHDEVVQTFPKGFMDLLTSYALKARDVENFFDKYYDSILEYSETEEGDGFQWGNKYELDDLKYKLDKIVSSIKGKVVKNKFPRNDKYEIVLNTDKYYYIDWEWYTNIAVIMTGLSKEEKDLLTF